MYTENQILITGGSGMVGSQAHFGIKPGREELDILDKGSIEQAIMKYEPEVIVHLAAIVDMAWSETHKEETFLTNVTGTENIALACKSHGIKLVYLSSGAVFGANKDTPYSEDDQTGPVNVYGKTKLEGEKVIQRILGNDSLIVRTGWLFGGGEKDKKFIKAFYLKFKNGEEINAVSDRYGSPTYVPDLISKIYELINEDKTGIYHVVNSGCVSYYEVAEEIKRIGNFKNNVKKVLYKDLPQGIVPRGNMEGLTSTKIKLRSWKDVVKEYLTKLT